MLLTEVNNPTLTDLIRGPRFFFFIFYFLMQGALTFSVGFGVNKLKTHTFYSVQTCPSRTPYPVARTIWNALQLYQ